MKFFLLLVSAVAAADFYGYFNSNNSQVMDLPDYTVHWAVAEDTLTVGIEARTEGYVGFGISELASASMPGADILIAYFDQKSENIVLKDTYALGKSNPIEDESQDWELIGGKLVDGITIFAATRKLNTGDAQDREVFINQAVPVIVATGPMYSGRWSYHSPTKRRSSFIHFGSKAYQLANAHLDSLKNDPDVEYFEFFNDHLITDEPTQYVDIFTHERDPSTLPDFVKTRRVCKDRDDLQDNDGKNISCASIAIIGQSLAKEGQDKCDSDFGGTSLRNALICPETCGECSEDSGGTTKPEEFEAVHIIAWEPLIQEDTKQGVHHFVVYGVSDTVQASTYAHYTWASGTGPNFTPDACGFKMSPKGLTGLQINTHYDNSVGALTGKRDRSGVRVYYTKKLRQHNCGLLQVGDGILRDTGLQFPKGTSRTTYHCPSSFSQSLGDTVLNVFDTLLHMHSIGKRMWTTLHTTNDAGEKVSRKIARNDYFDEAFTIAVPAQSVQIKAGDAFTTTCVHNSPDGSHRYGPASDEEMCINFIRYYPEVEDFNYCGRATERFTPVPDDKSCFGVTTGSCSKDEVPTTILERAMANTEHFAPPSLLIVSSPANLFSTNLQHGHAVFGPSVPITPLTAEFVLFDNTVALLGCNPLLKNSNVDGNIAIVVRGACPFVNKVLNAQNAGAIAAIVINNVAGEPVEMMGANPSITIPSVMISDVDGALIVAELQKGTTVDGTLTSKSGKSSPTDIPIAGEGFGGMPAGMKMKMKAMMMMDGMMNPFGTAQSGLGGMASLMKMMTMMKMKMNGMMNPFGIAQTACKDDAAGMLAENGATCAQVAMLGCDADLNSVNPEAPKGTFVKMLCPVTCKNCPVAPVAPAAPAATVPACQKQAYTIMNSKYKEKCVGDTNMLKTCGGGDVTLVTLSREKGQVMLTNNKGHCFNVSLKFGKCDPKRSLVVNEAPEGSFYLKLYTKGPYNKCANALKTGKLITSRCNFKARSQRFYLVPKL